MNTQLSFVALQCNACSGELTVPTAQVVEGARGSFKLIGNDVFVCPFCGTKYLPTQQLQRYEARAGIHSTGAA